MNERERWIVYPLVLFALGAALRDKFLQHVSTKEVECQRLVAKSIECEGGILCQGVVVLDPANRNLRLVELGQAEPMDASGQIPERLGILVLRDSKGRDLCSVVNDALYVRQVDCEGVRVIDPGDHRRTLAGLASISVKVGDSTESFGVLALNNKSFGTLTGNPPRESMPADSAGQPAADEPPADGSTQPGATEQDEQAGQADQ